MNNLYASVIGSGIMGSGIAIACALNQVNVYVNDVSEEILDKSKRFIIDILNKLWEEEIIDEDPSEVIDRIYFIRDLKTAVSDSYIIFESVPEKLDVKRDLFRRIGKVNDNAILASNTSVIKISDISEGLEVRERIIGVHWMNPPYILPIVEVAPSRYTNDDITSKTIIYLRNILGKIVVKVPDISGYIVNRFNAVIASEAVRLVDEGVSIKDIDMIWRYHLGIILMLYGPFMNMDYIGLDTVYMAGTYLSHELGRELIHIPRWFEKMVLNGKLGVKTGEGFYDYKGRETNELYFDRVKKLYEVLRWLQERR